ncbi:MAG: cryptochrome/photolyase family protein [Ilumatobacteraceae bacterium]|nr:cryptochrome/photolyase family protein [Ilumatobacteraceae bacterium]
MGVTVDVRVAPSATLRERVRVSLATVWVLGDQLSRRGSALAAATPATHRVLMVESLQKLQSKHWHVQRAHFVIASMRRFADELRAEGFDVDYRRAASLPAGLAAHRADFDPTTVMAMEPASRAGLTMLRSNGATVTKSNQFLTHPEEFAVWAHGRKRLTMEDFYRWQRRRLSYLMDGDEPVGGSWNFDAENRQRPPKDGRNHWPSPLLSIVDELDREVLRALPGTVWGAAPDGTWATTRAEALRRLHHFIDELLPRFGPHEDAMLSGSWHLAHGLLAQYLNVGLLHPREVCDAADAAYRGGRVPIASAEGFIRQVIGWREYVWGIYWLRGAEYRELNVLDAQRPLPPVLTGRAPTKMRCVSTTLQTLHDHGWVHHIQRLMILGNLALLAGVQPRAMTEWMWAGFVDGAEWVMVPNVIGMALYADGGMMSTKPYAAGGAYIDKMSDYCKGCRFDRTKRTGPDACPYTTLYWDFLARHEERFAKNPRVVQQVRAAQRLGDLTEVRVRAREVLDLLDRGEL